LPLHGRLHVDLQDIDRAIFCFRSTRKLLPLVPRSRIEGDEIPDVCFAGIHVLAKLIEAFFGVRGRIAATP
jgi:hypothetical protein